MLFCPEINIRRLALQTILTLSLTTHIVANLDKRPYDGSTVPGDSPVKYHNSPNNDLFRIESLDMHPNPCVIESYCSVLLRGQFTTSLTNTTPHVSFNVTSHFPDGRTGLLPGEDDFCNWVDIVQDKDINPVRRRKRTTRRCPPDKGPAEISSTVLLLGGWVPEANYTVRVKATEGVRTIFDLWTKLELLNKDEVVVKGENRGLASITGGQRQGVKLELL